MPQPESLRTYLFPQSTWRPEWRPFQHTAPITRLLQMPGGKLISLARDGTVRVWSRDLRPLQCLTNSLDSKLPSPRAKSSGPCPSWPLDGTFVTSHAQARARLVVCNLDRVITFFDVLPAEHDPDRPDETTCLALSGAVTLPPATGPATCLASLPPSHAWTEQCNPSAERVTPHVAYGTQSGAINVLRVPQDTMERSMQIRTGEGGGHHGQGRTAPERGDVSYTSMPLHREHTDWVAALLVLPNEWLLSCSLDSTIKMYDPGRGAIAGTSTVHSGPVRCTAYCGDALGMVASGGCQPSVKLWHPRGDPSRIVGELSGHEGGVVAVDTWAPGSRGGAPMIATLSGMGVVSLWDLRRTVHPLESIKDADWPQSGDSRPAALLCDAHQGAAPRVITGRRKPAACVLKTDRPHADGEKLPEAMEDISPPAENFFGKAQKSLQPRQHSAVVVKASSSTRGNAEIGDVVGFRPYSHLKLGVISLKCGRNLAVVEGNIKK